MSAVMNNKFPFGCAPPKMLRGFPPGKIKVRIRYNEFPMIYVRNDEGISCYYPKEAGDAWEPAVLVSQNWRPK